MSLRRTLHRWIWPQRGERLKATIVYGLVAIVIAAAVALTGVRLVFAIAPSLTQVVETALAKRLGRPITITRLDAELQGWRPGLTLEGVALGLPAGVDSPLESPLRLERLTLGIEPWESLLAGELRLHSLEAGDLAIRLRRGASGKWRLSGLAREPAAVGVNAPLGLLQRLPVDRLLIRDASVTIADGRNDTRVTFAPAALRWQREAAGQWRVALDGRAGDQRITARADVNAGDNLRARIYVDFSDLSPDGMAPIAGNLIPSGLQGRFSGEAWLAWDEQGLRRGTVALRGDSLGWLAGGVERFAGRIGLSRQAGGWQGVVVADEVAGDHGVWSSLPPIGVARSDDQSPWRLAAPALDPGAPGYAALQAMTGVAVKRGGLRDLSLVWDGPQDWRFESRFTRVRVNGGPPDVTIEDGQGALAMGPVGGRVDFAAAGLRVAAPALLRQPVGLQQISGALAWAHGESGPRVMAVEGLEARYDEADLQLDARVWPAQSERSAWVDLTASVGSMPASAAMRHLPVGVMDDRLVAWLDGAIGPGRLSGGRLRFLGPLQSFPFDRGRGVFDLRLDLADLVFRFSRQWPAIEALSGVVRFNNRALGIRADGGRIGSLPVVGGSARIEDLWRPRLLVNAGLNGPLSAMQSVLAQSPLVPSAAFLDGLTLEGAGALDLTLGFPFEGRPVSVDGVLDMDGAGLALERPAIRIDDLSGAIRFDERGPAWDNLQGRLGDHVLVSQASTTGPPDDGEMRIQINARLPISAIPGGGPFAEGAEGVAPWRMVLQRPAFGGDPLRLADTRLTLETALDGIALDWPLGLDKPADARTPLAAEFVWQGARALRFDIDYDDRLRLQGRHADGRLQALGGRLGAGEAVAPPANGTRLVGALPALAVDALLGGGDGQAGRRLEDLPEPLDVAVALDGFRLGRWQVGETRIEAMGEADRWRIGLTGAAQGEIRWPGEDERLTVRLERLEATVPSTRSLPPPSAASAAPEAVREPVGPDLDIRIGSLTVAGRAFGQLDFQRRDAGLATASAQLSVAGEPADLDVEIRRQADENAGNRLEFDLFTRDGGAVVRALGLQRVLDGATGSVTGDMRWVGPLLRPIVPTLSGELALDLRNGSLPAVEPGAGRALGLFSLSVLPRRLDLDFSDVVGEGLQFDSLKGDWQARAGTLYTDNLSLEGPSLNLAVTGSTDLVRRRYNQRVTVTPRISSALSFLGGLAGGPPAAVFLFLTRGMLESGVERLAEFQYRIVGPWADPRFELLTPIGPDGEGDSDEQS
ncbi:UNVERIFIED_CONTAM: TIGR02099 family protein [Spiribacter pallidus]